MLLDSFGSALDFSNPNQFANPSQFSVPGGNANMSSNVGFLAPATVGVVNTPISSPTPVRQASPDAFSGFLNSVGNGIGALITNGLSTAGTNLANRITANPTFKGTNTTANTAGAQSVLSSYGPWLLLAAGAVAIFLIVRK